MSNLKKDDVIDRLVAFIDRHGGVIENALRVYSDYMTREADNALKAYDEISADPEKTAAQNKTMLTVNGIRQSSLLFKEAAERANVTLDAWREMTEQFD